MILVMDMAWSPVLSFLPQLGQFNWLEQIDHRVNYADIDILTPENEIERPDPLKSYTP